LLGCPADHNRLFHEAAAGEIFDDERSASGEIDITLSQRKIKFKQVVRIYSLPGKLIPSLSNILLLISLLQKEPLIPAMKTNPKTPWEAKARPIESQRKCNATLFSIYLLITKDFDSLLLSIQNEECCLHP
jgi:hypothetical protein